MGKVNRNIKFYTVTIGKKYEYDGQESIIYLIKEKLKKQLNILMMKWKNLLKIFMSIKNIKKKTMACHYESSSFILHSSCRTI